jgi:hypothetical protein
MSNQPAEFLEKAKIAIHKGDQKAAKSLLNQILQRDIKHPEAWQLLYRNFGSEEPFETFQRQYTKKNFPKKINDLNDQKEPSVRRVSLGRMRDRPARGSKPEREPNADSQPSKSEKKRGLISRISSIFRRKPKSQIKPITPDRPVEPSPPVKTEKGPIRLSSLKNTPPTPSLREELSIVPPTPTISAPPLAFTRETQTLPKHEKI